MTYVRPKWIHLQTPIDKKSPVCSTLTCNIKRGYTSYPKNTSFHRILNIHIFCQISSFIQCLANTKIHAVQFYK